MRRLLPTNTHPGVPKVNCIHKILASVLLNCTVLISTVHTSLKHDIGEQIGRFMYLIQYPKRNNNTHIN